MRRGLLVLLVAAAVWPLAAEQSGNPSTDAARSIARLRWRSIGPNNFAGRIVDIVGIPGNPAVFRVTGPESMTNIRAKVTTM